MQNIPLLRADVPAMFTFDKTDRRVAHTLRFLSIEAVQCANSGHPGLPLGAADIVTVLWSRFLKHNPACPTWPDRDRFILSAGHGSALLYSLLTLWGYPLGLEDLISFRQWNSRTPGHPERNPDLGIEITTGPLGQGFASAVGISLAERWLAIYFNRPGFELVDHHTYVLASDGDLMEGVSHEAASLAGHLKLGRLIVFYDDNRISIDGPTSLCTSDDVAARFSAYGWHVQAVDGHDCYALSLAIQAARQEKERPSLLICRTHIGYGSPRQDNSISHGEPLGEQNIRATKQALDWPENPPFFIPQDVTERIESYRRHSASQYTQWEYLLAQYRLAYPNLAAEWDRYIRGDLPQGWQSTLSNLNSDKPMATRAASGLALDALARSVPFILGGSADLTPSNNTHPTTAVDIQPGNFTGNYIRFGIREHAMGAVLNGLVLHGLHAYGGTFLVFSDYMRPAIRLAALMRLPVIYIFTHDSIGLGEDGPTHQPIEHITSLRAIPNLIVLRPADTTETLAAWQIALEHHHGPVALILTRQTVHPVSSNPAGLARGAYILHLPEPPTTPKIVLVATGSEVWLAVQACQRLHKMGIRAQVVSMPSWELFDQQPESYRSEVFPRGVPVLSIEAGSTLAWSRYTRNPHASIGINHFGASAPAPILFEKFGITIDEIVLRAAQMTSG